MINILWAGLILIGITVGIATGDVKVISDTILNSAKDSVALVFSLIGIYALWLGLLNIAEASGLVKTVAKRLQPVLSFLFKDIKNCRKAMGYISLNMVANILGMGNAATPFGLKAMEEMQKVNKDKKMASNSMCMFLIINTSSIQIIPLTIIGIRSAANSVNPAEITLTALAATAITTMAGIIGAKACEIKGRKN